MTNSARLIILYNTYKQQRKGGGGDEKLSLALRVIMGEWSAMRKTVFKFFKVKVHRVFCVQINEL
jgi:hypothetical protein